MDTMSVVPNSKIEDSAVCRKCGGDCCKRSPGAAFPADFPEPLEESLQEALFSGNWAVDWLGENEEALYIRPRIRGIKPTMDPAISGPCGFLTPTGCTLQYESRPTECRQLQPKPPHCTTGGPYNKAEAAEAWSAHRRLIRELAAQLDGNAGNMQNALTPKQKLFSIVDLIGNCFFRMADSVFLVGLLYAILGSQHRVVLILSLLAARAAILVGIPTLVGRTSGFALVGAGISGMAAGVLSLTGLWFDAFSASFAFLVAIVFMVAEQLYHGSKMGGILWILNRYSVKRFNKPFVLVDLFASLVGLLAGGLLMRIRGNGRILFSAAFLLYFFSLALYAALLVLRVRERPLEAKAKAYWFVKKPRLEQIRDIFGFVTIILLGLAAALWLS